MTTAIPFDATAVSRRLTDLGAEVSADVPLATLTTLRLGGPATVLARCADTAVLADVVRALDASGVPLLVVAGGSNLVVGDAGFAGVAVRIDTAGTDLDDDLVRVDAGAVWDDVVAATVAAGRGGLECLSGIPGSAGATPVQNVGAYGVEVASALRRARLLDRRTGEIAWVGPERLGLGYRTSVLKHSDDALVLEVELAVDPAGRSAPVGYRELATALGVAEGERVESARVRDAVLALRRGKGMVLDATDHDTWSAGSFFTNPIVPDADLAPVLAAIRARVGDDARIPRFPADGGTKLSAGWLIERAGFTRGHPGEGAPVRLSTRHTLALTNRGAGRADDLIALAREVRDGVRDAFGVTLHPEPVTVGCTV